jgi:arabinogalactan endo-1,4-beta-galactosidase
MPWFNLMAVTLLSVVLSACAGNSATPAAEAPVSAVSVASAATASSSSAPKHAKATQFYVGADLSYVNEMQDCGAEYRLKGKSYDPFLLFAGAKANVLRVRLWHNPNWTHYSNLADATKTIRRAKAAGMNVLLDLHYSDTWADPEKQFVPAAWAPLVGDTPALGQALYDYTYGVLSDLAAQGLTPEMIQVGNETNAEILQLESAMSTTAINWQRNAYLFNKGLQAVADFNRNQSASVQTLLHIAQPENALWWFKQARAAGVTNFDIIGLSYYPKWSTYGLDSVGKAIAELKATYGKEVMIVETAYPWTLEGFDQASNLLGADSLVNGYKATPEGQYDYLMQLSQQVINAGGMGLIYWEPAWVSTSCSTLWGQGSHWENASFFYPPTGNDALKAMMFFQDALGLYQRAD